MTEKVTPTTLSFPANLAAEANKGQNFVRFEVHELKNGVRDNYYNIHLFPPIGFTASDAGNYGTVDRGAIGAGMDAVLTKMGFKPEEETMITAPDLQALQAANRDLLSGIPFADIIQRTSRLAAMEMGIAQNPNTAVTYEGHQLRSFTFDFKMISESSEQAKTVARIVDVLRNYSLPDATGALSIQYPAHFEIEFYQGEEPNTFMPKIFTSHLTSLNVIYNQTTNIFHPDGAPVETDVQMTFQEIQTLTREDLYGDRFEGLDEDYQLLDTKDYEKRRREQGFDDEKNGPKASTVTEGSSA